MRTILFILSICLISLGLHAQKVSEKKFNVSYQVPPPTRLDPAFTTYSVRVGNGRSSLQDMGLTESAVVNKLKLRNFKKIGNNGHLMVQYNIGRFDIDLGETKSQTTETKKKDGTVVKTTTYWQELPYTFPISMRVEDIDGNIVYEELAGSQQAILRYPKSGGETSKTTMLTNLRKNLKAESKKLMKSQVESLTDRFNQGLRGKIDVLTATDYLFLEYPSGKKAEDAEAWEISANTAHGILSTIKADEPLSTDLRQQLEAQITFWESKLNEYDPGDKKQRKYYHSAAFNLAVVDYLLEDFAAAETRAAELENSVNWNKDRSRSIKGKAAAATGKLGLYPTGSRHYPLRDLENAEGPAVENAPEPEAVELEEVPGFIINRQGTKIEGTVSYPKGIMAIGNFSPRHLRFTGADGNLYQVVPSEVNQVKFGNYHYNVQDLNDTGGGKRRNFFRILESGEIKLYQYQPFYRNTNNSDNTLFLGMQDGKRISLDFTNPRWVNWKKAFAKIFEGCPKLQADIEAGLYARSPSPIRDAVIKFNAKEDCN